MPIKRTALPPTRTKAAPPVKKAKKKAGRKTVYESKVHPKLQDIERWAGDGLTDKDIYANLGIKHSAFYDYLNQHAEFSEALKRGKVVAIQKVENALFKKATGYEFTETSHEESTDDKGVQVTEKTTVKHIPPSDVAMIFFLKNRKPDDWADKIKTESDMTIHVAAARRPTAAEQTDMDQRGSTDHEP